MPDTIPYHPLSPPDDPTLFFGREDAIAFLRQHLVGGNNLEMLVILGRTGIGKTSVLMHVPSIVDERYQPIYVDADSLDSPYSYISSIVSRIVQRMELIGASTYRVPELPPAAIAEEELLRWFAEDFLDVATTAIHRNRFLLLLLDDFHQVFNAIDDKRLPAYFVEYLGDLLKKYDRLSMVAGLNIDYEDRALRHEPVANMNYHFRLQHLDETAARQLITEPIVLKYQYTEDAIARILKLGGGHPFLLHSVCRLLYRHYRNNPEIPQITASVVGLVHTAALEETGEIIRDFWQRTTPAQKITVTALLDFYRQNPDGAVSFEQLKTWMDTADTGINSTQLAATLRSLEYDLLVKVTETGDYRFATALEADWLLANTNLKNLREEKVRRSSRFIGLMAVIAVLVIIAVILASGMLDDSETATPDNDIPPTSTLHMDIDATGSAATKTFTPD